MQFLKKLFGSGGSRGDNRTIYLYVRPKRCDKIAEIKIDLYNELSLNDTEDGYFVRKIAQIIRCPFPSEVHIRFNKRRQIIEQTAENGEFVTREEYEEWLAQQS